MIGLTGRVLARRYGVTVKQGLYRETGDWYHLLNKFPAALFDVGGYLYFTSYDDFDRFVETESGVSHSKEKNWLFIKDGISSQRGYVAFLSMFPEEVDSKSPVFEGAVQSVLVNRYERNRVARKKCIDHWGTTCVVCSFSFSAFYGATGGDFIHVHHLTPIASIRSEYVLDPVKDLRPVCPNCHAMLHLRVPPYRLGELKEMIAQAAS